MITRTTVSVAGTPALQEGGRILAAHEFARRSRREAAWLSASTVCRAGLLAANGISWVTADDALMRAGLVNVPMPDHFSDAQLVAAIDDAGLDAILTDDPSRVLALEAGFELTAQTPASGLTLLRRKDGFAVPLLPDGTAKITYTSGSTATPKGVCLTASSMARVVDSLTAVSRSLDLRRHLVLLPLSTLLENLAGASVPLRAGATCVLAPAAVTGVTATSVDPGKLLRALTMLQPESLILVPQLLQTLVTAVERGWAVPASLRFIAVGGARVPAELLDRSIAAGLPCYEGYGLSECASVVALNTPDNRRAGSVGRPMSHARVRLSDDGEILVSGATMAGYTGQPRGEPPAEVATGDLGALDQDGFLYVHGRRKNMFITSFGRNLSPEWIEAELTAGPVIAHAVVFGEARPFNVAVLSPAGAGVSGQDAARAVAAANQRLPQHARILKWILAPRPFSFDGGLLTANGRPRRAVIEQSFRASIDALYQDLLAS